MSEINLIAQVHRELCLEGRPPLILYSGNPNEHGFFFPSEILSESYGEYFQKQSYDPHPRGLLAARRAISDYYAEEAFEISPENILLTAGTSESFFYLFSFLTSPGDQVLVPRPAYPLFEEIARLAKIELRHYSLNEEEGWKIDLENLRENTDARTKAILLVSPNNPTGAVHSDVELEAVVEWANRRDIAVICDEVFSEFYFGEGSFPRAAVRTRPKLCFTLNGLSKMLALPALKLSWIAVSGEDARVAAAVEELERMADVFLSCHTPVQHALPTLLRRREDFLLDYSREVRRRRDAAWDWVRRFPGVRAVAPRGGFYGMVRLTRETCEESWVIRLMREKGVFVHPGYFFDDESGAHFIFSFLTEPKRLEEGMARIFDFLSE